MHYIQYIIRHLVNNIFRIFAIICGKPLQIFEHVLIVSPHPDDEILGCGGLITHLNQQNKTVSIIFLTKGENCCPEIDSETLKTERRKLTNKALAKVGQSMNQVYFLDFTDGKIHMEDPEIEKLKSLLHQINPQAIFVTHQLEGWNDHSQAHRILKTLTKDKQIRLFEYCVWFWYTMPGSKIFNIQWKNARFFRMGEEQNRTKKKAIGIYMQGKSPEGFPYSGKLPSVLLKSCSWKEELYFENSDE